MYSITIIGGDRRQTEMNKLLNRMGYTSRQVISSADLICSEAERNDVIILPVPVTKDGVNVYSSNSSGEIKLNDVLTSLTEDNFVFGGGFPDTVCSYFTDEKISYFDYLRSDEFAEYNAYLTGIGALRLLFENTNEDIRFKKILITGFGRVARYTAKVLSDMGCDVCVTARNPLQLMQAECVGYGTVEFERKKFCLQMFDYIFNTVPEIIFDQEEAGYMKGIYFELASAPFGVPKECFINKKEKHIYASALPGKYLAFSAAKKLAEITDRYLKLRNGGD